jgi:hypothetical protein
MERASLYLEKCKTTEAKKKKKKKNRIKKKIRLERRN